MKKLLPLCSGIAVLSAVGSAFGATDPMINKLMREKQQKMEQLEQCAKKVKGFKIAGISTLGLTAVGIGGNVALAVKQKGLNTQIENTQNELKAKKTELVSINSKIAEKEAEAAARQAELASEESEDDNLANVDEKPNIGDACNEKDINNKAVASAVFVVAGGDAGGIICNQNGQNVPCVCSATKCVDEAREVSLSDGIKTCEIADLKGRVINGKCNKEDLPSTTASDGTYYALGRKFTIEKDKWASTECYASAKSKNIVNCACQATACKDPYEVVNGLCKKKVVAEQPAEEVAAESAEEVVAEQPAEEVAAESVE